MSLNKFLKFHGKSATLTNFTEDSVDSYGDSNTSSTTSSTSVIIERNLTQSDIAVTEAGQDVRIDALIYIDDEETVRDGEDANFPTEVNVDSQDYEIQAVDDLGNGYLQCLAKRI